MSAMLKNLLLSTYYYGSLPLRQWRLSQLARQGRSPVMVLFYHRVANANVNPWTISRERFRRQIDWMEKNFDIVSLEEAQRRVRNTGNIRPAVSITFDDGYAENYEYALPMLVERRIPCTYFVTTDNILKGKPFPHDLANGVALPPNSIQQIQWMSEQGIEIGAHTQTHLDLGPIEDEETLYREVVLPGQILGNYIQRPVRYFAFPFGQHRNMNSTVFNMARATGYEGVVSAYGGYNFPGDDPFHLQRIHADPEMIYLKNWLTCDPRKIKMTQRFQYTIDTWQPQQEGVLV